MCYFIFCKKNSPITTIIWGMGFFSTVVFAEEDGVISQGTEETKELQSPVVPSELPSPLSMSLSYVSEPMIHAHVSNPKVNYVSGVELNTQWSKGFVNSDVENWKEIEHWVFTLDIQQYMDTGDLGTQIGVVNPPQEIFNPQGVYLGELSATRNGGEDDIYLKVGSISMDADFLAPEVTGWYTHTAFNNQYNVSIPIFPISPLQAYGVVVGKEVQEEHEVFVKGGVYQLSAVRSDFANRGWNWETTTQDGLVEIVEVSGAIGDNEETVSVCPPREHTFSRKTKHCDANWEVVNELPQGSWQVGAFVSQSDTQTDGTRLANDAVYANVTLPLGDKRDHLWWVSGVYGLQPQNNPVPVWVGTGWLSQGFLTSRPLDVLLLGASWSHFSLDDWQNKELLLEVEYAFVLTNAVTLQGNAMWFAQSVNMTEKPLLFGLAVQAGF